MGNKLMRRQTNFKHLMGNTPKMKPTPAPHPAGHSQSAIKPKEVAVKSHMSQKVKNEHKYPIYEFGRRKKLQASEFQTYVLPEAISVLTYNIWFQSHNKDIRYECILRILELSNCDFICLQEVTKDFVDLLHSLSKDSWIKSYYTGIIPMGWYDTLILTKYKCLFYKIPFENSFMSRSMIFAELLQPEGRNVVVGCMHYQSLNGNQQIRKQQILQVQDLTKDCSRVIIAGDFNFGDDYEENKAIDKQYVDLWVRLRNLEEDRYTMPQSVKFPPWRTDHILCKLPKQVDLGTAEIHKVGQFTIPPFEDHKVSQIGIDNIVRTPSDHFGLISWIPLK